MVNAEMQLIQAPTTPAWDSAMRMVKEEQQDDKNNDSGVSQGHYTSDSASTTSTANCLSPESLASHDEYPTAGHPHLDNDFGEYYSSPRHSPLDGSQLYSPSQMVSVEMSGSEDNGKLLLPDNLAASPDNLKCPLCKFSTRDRLAFASHLSSHCNNVQGVSFIKSVIDQLTNGSGMKEDGRDDAEQQPSSLELEEEPGLRVPRLNAQGKVKAYRCKQCAFMAITKLDFWEHSRAHIKPEKLLTCPKCPFVSEYKHHLEYHLRNHFGSKPYKCDRCAYSCVNKSMLNSHLKSHSNVYQFRCSDCSYATKYCHSLKLHLRKYDHRPAMVLNADGSPNPLPIIDVYGTRRGPKSKPKKDKRDTSPPPADIVSAILPAVLPHNQQQQQQQQQQEHYQHQPQSPERHSPEPSQPIQAQQHKLQQQLVQQQQKLFYQHQQQQQQQQEPQLAAMPGAHSPQFPLSSLDALNQMNFAATSAALMGFPFLSRFCINPFDNPPRELPPGQQQPHVEADRSGFGSQLREQFAGSNTQQPPQSPPSAQTAPFVKHEKREEFAGHSPLDLSTHDARAFNPQSAKAASRNSRRKGKAVKLDRHALARAHDSDEEQNESGQSLGPPSPVSSENSSNGNSASSVASQSAAAADRTLFCPHCLIVFGNQVMHSVHMGYHGYYNPFTCNMCGVTCPDSISFYIHLTRSSH